MPELRWTLLVIGVLFIAALAWWERRRQRRSPRHAPESTPESVPHASGPGTQSYSVVTRPDGASVPLGFERAGEEDWLQREPTLELPVLHAEPRAEESFAATRESDLIESPRDESPSWRDSAFEMHATRREPTLGSLDEEEPEYARQVAEERGSSVPERFVSEEGEFSVPDGFAAAEGESSVSDEFATEERESVPAPFAAGEEETGEARPAEPLATEFVVEEPVVDWPDEASRRIITLRLVSGPVARFAGRAVRQALAAEGFVLGRYDIFHKPGPDGRALLSAASLTKPGTFALSTMDTQRFGGLSLFAVLPGPLPAQKTYDELLATARALNERLQGALQDEHGEPLTPVRSANIRATLTDAVAEGAPEAEPPR